MAKNRFSFSHENGFTTARPVSFTNFYAARTVQAEQLALRNHSLTACAFSQWHRTSFSPYSAYIARRDGTKIENILLLVFVVYDIAVIDAGRLRSRAVCETSQLFYAFVFLHIR